MEYKELVPLQGHKNGNFCGNKQHIQLFYANLYNIGVGTMAFKNYWGSRNVSNTLNIKTIKLIKRFQKTEFFLNSFQSWNVY